MARSDIRRRLESLAKQIPTTGRLPVSAEEFYRRLDRVVARQSELGSLALPDTHSPEVATMTDLELMAVAYPWLLECEAKLGIETATDAEFLARGTERGR